MTDYFLKSQSVNAEYYFNLLIKQSIERKTIREDEERCSLFFLQNNGPAHKTLVILKNLGLDCTNHPRNTPDLASYDIFLFPHFFKKYFKGKKLSTAPTEQYFNDQISILKIFFDV